jgi:ribosome-binding factor A
MPNDNRPARVGAQVRQELARLVSRDLADPRLTELVVTNVVMSGDLRLAKVLWRLATVASGAEHEARRADAKTALERSSGRLKKAVTARLKLRYAPELRFVYDAGQDARDRIELLLHEVREDDKKRGG